MGQQNDTPNFYGRYQHIYIYRQEIAKYYFGYKKKSSSCIQLAHEQHDFNSIAGILRHSRVHIINENHRVCEKCLSELSASLQLFYKQWTRFKAS